MHPEHREELRRGLLRGLVWTLVAAVLLVILNVFGLARASNDLGPIDRSRLLFPYYGVDDVINSTVVHHHARHTADLLQQLNLLEQSAVQYCRGDQALASLKQQFRHTYLSWLELSAVVWGPMLQNNTVRLLDFRPLRVNLLERAVSRQPSGEAQMKLVGSPAKGFPAIEYLLSQPTFIPGSASCNYAQEVTRDMVRSVSSLQWQSADSANVDVEAEAGQLQAQMQLYFNQLVGALHNLAWERMEKPLLKHTEEPDSDSSWPLAELGLTQAAWSSQWQSVMDLLVIQRAAAPDPAREVVPLEAYLRGLGQIELADTLVSHTRSANQAMQANQTDLPATVELSVVKLKALKNFLEQEVAKGLKVSIQFSSSDGD